MYVLLPPGATTPVFNYSPSLHLIDCVYWTDAHHFNPYMTKMVFGLMRRPSDGFLFWDHEALNLGNTDAGQPWIKWCDVLPAPIECEWPLEWRDLEFVEHATEADYFTALDCELTSSRENELQVRLELYRIYNHPVRYGERRRDCARHKHNERRLLEMLSLTEEFEVVMCAEILRNSGQFEDSLEVLKSRKPTDNSFLEARAAKIAELAQSRIEEVAVYEGKIKKPRAPYGILTGF
jgi:hypothetical protein